MTTLDKVALILSKHGYSLTEGMKILMQPARMVNSCISTKTKTVWCG